MNLIQTGLLLLYNTIFFIFINNNIQNNDNIFNNKNNNNIPCPNQPSSRTAFIIFNNSNMFNNDNINTTNPNSNSNSNMMTITITSFIIVLRTNLKGAGMQEGFTKGRGRERMALPTHLSNPAPPTTKPSHPRVDCHHGWKKSSKHCLVKMNKLYILRGKWWSAFYSRPNIPLFWSSSVLLQ